MAKRKIRIININKPIKSAFYNVCFGITINYGVTHLSFIIKSDYKHFKST